jgi:hypothetical protein
MKWSNLTRLLSASGDQNSEDISGMVATINSLGPILDDVVMHGIEVVNELPRGRTNNIDGKTPADRAPRLEAAQGWSA